MPLLSIKIKWKKHVPVTAYINFWQTVLRLPNEGPCNAFEQWKMAGKTKQGCDATDHAIKYIADKIKIYYLWFLKESFM